MSKARSENRVKGCGVYYEEHHIIPKCMKGEGNLRQWRFHPNIILLTAQEHFISHKLLCEIYPNNPKLWFALEMFLNTNGKQNNRNIKIGSREYSRIRENASKLRSEKMKGLRVGPLHPMFGKKQSEESKRNMSLNTKGDKNPMKRPEVLAKFIGENNHMYGKNHSDSTLIKISQKAVGRKSPRKNVKLSETTKEKLRIANLGKKFKEMLTYDKYFEVRQILDKKNYTRKQISNITNVGQGTIGRIARFEKRFEVYDLRYENELITL